MKQIKYYQRSLLFIISPVDLRLCFLRCCPGVLPGQCVCKEGFAGEKCDRCAFGYRDFPLCTRCECSLEGSHNIDPCKECVCKVRTNHSFHVYTQRNTGFCLKNYYADKPACLTEIELLYDILLVY